MKSPALTLVTLLAALARCGAGRAAPEPLQGVVEYDERVLAFDVAGRIRASTLVRGGEIHVRGAVATLDDSLDRPQRAARLADLEGARAQLALLRAGSRREDVRSAASQLEATRASEALLQRTFARQDGLVTHGAVASASLDELNTQLVQTRGAREMQVQRLAELRRGARPEEIAAAVARVSGAQAALDALDARLEHFTLRAPLDATVLDVHAEPGEVVAPGTPVATVGDLDHPYVDVFVPQAHVDLRLGDPMAVRIDAFRTPFPGRVEHIAEETEFTPRFLFSERERPNLVVRVRVRIDDPGHHVHAGLPAFVSVAAR